MFTYNVVKLSVLERFQSLFLGLVKSQTVHAKDIAKVGAATWAVSRRSSIVRVIVGFADAGANELLRVEEPLHAIQAAFGRRRARIAMHEFETIAENENTATLTFLIWNFVSDEQLRQPSALRRGRIEAAVTQRFVVALLGEERGRVSPRKQAARNRMVVNLRLTLEK